MLQDLAAILSEDIECVGGITVIGMENEIIEPSSKMPLQKL